MKYNFLENNLPSDFAQLKVNEIKSHIENGESITTIAMPGVGVTHLMRFLTRIDNAYVTYIDVYDLTNLNKEEFYLQLLKNLDTNTSKNEANILDVIKERLLELINEHGKVVIICNHFDQLVSESDTKLLKDIHQLTRVFPKKIVFIFTSNIPLYDFFPNEISPLSLSSYSRIYYFGLFKNADIRSIMNMRMSLTEEDQKRLEVIYPISNGHLQLTQMIYKSEFQENPVYDTYVRLVLSTIYDYLNFHRKQAVQKIAQNKYISNIDPYLINLGLVREEEGKQTFFTPLFAQFIQGFVSFKLPVKERKLLKLLKKHPGEVVDKDEIFDYVWQDSSEGATDWALNALIYRLRKNPQLKNSGYEIVSVKKQGYMLMKI